MITCIKCGQLNADGNRYCSSCGDSLLTATPQCGQNQYTQAQQVQISSKSRLAALLLCIFFGVFGVHRFYVGKVGTGIVWILTIGGGFGIGALVDLIMIICGTFKDIDGRRLIKWTD